jgi:hypothetical protein
MNENLQVATKLEKNNIITTVLKHITTGIDGESFDIGRVMWVIGVLTYIGLSIFQLVKHQTFDPIAWASGFAIICGGSGVALKLKEKTEPQERG